ncbi:hypothetical protein [Clostridium sp. JS66]|uniref:hypothetical protein n=1 Tax=Clostridium sp. JS66 TaxID=3064705 RepID=UPI00298DF42F|nr:hypothetical protein [Clostridium sp. JS66]WPC39669.1 hypothetical protein Q6H37_17315 [Clostridium sp. JS66]
MKNKNKFKLIAVLFLTAIISISTISFKCSADSNNSNEIFSSQYSSIYNNVL